MNPLFAILTALYCAGIYWASSRRVPELPNTGLIEIDKVAHAVVFGGLAFLVAIGLHFSRRAHPPQRLFWVPLLFAAAYGALDELHQHFIPYRTYDPYDWLADVAGAAVMQVILCLAWWRLPWRKALLGTKGD